MQIADRTVVMFHYTLTDEDGQVIDSSREQSPLAYLHGAGNIVPGLEKALVGCKQGDKLQVSVVPEEGYGLHQEDMVQVVPMSAFQGVPEPKPGMEFQAQGAHGPLAVVVTKVEGDQVTIDANHPLAGKTLNFDVEITEVRAASEEELSHGHVHGHGGAHH